MGQGLDIIDGEIEFEFEMKLVTIESQTTQSKQYALGVAYFGFQSKVPILF